MNNRVVPWYNCEEWFTVYKQIYSCPASSQDKAEALKLLLAWKSRCPFLPAGIESTFGLLQVQVEDTMLSGHGTKPNVLRLAYCSALMRFVNHMLDVESSKGTSLYKAAKRQGIPDWIIDLRHNAAHNNTLPTLELLREATSIALDWLHKNYWEMHKKVIKDCIVVERKGIDDNVEKITALVRFYITLSICAQTRTKVKNLSDIPDEDMRESFITETRELLGDYLDLSNLKTVSIMSLINIINAQSKQLLKSQNCGTVVAKVLVEEDSLFLSYDLLKLLTEKQFHHNDSLSKEYIECFEVLLTFLHTNNFILDVILELIALTKNPETVNHTGKLAAFWVCEILKALKKSQLFLAKTKNNRSDGEFPKKKIDLKLQFHHWFPNERSSALLLDLQKQVPHELTELGFVQPIISAYNPHLTYFIKDIIAFLEPPLPEANVNKICALAKLISKPNSEPKSKIYTVKDLQEVHDRCEDLSLNSDSVMDETPSDHISLIETNTIEQHIDSIWSLASTEYNWGTCPIGVLPRERDCELSMQVDN